MTSDRQLPRASLQALLVCFSLLSAAPAAWAHEGGLGNQVMWTVCEGRAINGSCMFVNLDHDVYRGSCQSMSNAMVCVRNQPIERASGAPHVHQHEPALDDAIAVREAWPWAAGLFILLVAGLAPVRMNGKRGFSV